MSTNTDTGVKMQEKRTDYEIGEQVRWISKYGVVSGTVSDTSSHVIYTLSIDGVEAPILFPSWELFGDGEQLHLLREVARRRDLLTSAISDITNELLGVRI